MAALQQRELRVGERVRLTPNSQLYEVVTYCVAYLFKVFDHPVQVARSRGDLRLFLVGYRHGLRASYAPAAHEPHPESGAVWSCFETGPEKPFGWDTRTLRARPKRSPDARGGSTARSS